MRVRFLLALVLAAGSAAATGLPEAPPPARPPGMTTCECVRNKNCWRLAKNAFSIIVGLKKSEVEGALPGRFSPGATVWALRHPGKDGHFLRVECGPNKVPCVSVRDLLEQRFAESSAVQSMSREPEKELFDPKTWALTGKGETVLRDAKRCRPGFWTELAPTLTGPSGWN